MAPNRRKWILSIVSVVVVLSLASRARPDGSPPAPGLWELDEETVFLEGCYPPCRCALHAQPGVTGSFVLGEPEERDGWLVYSVAEIDWTIPFEEPQRVSGTGEYWLEDIAEPRERLVLDLRIGDREPAKLQSETSPRGHGSGEIALAVSMNGMVCFDNVFELRASLTSPSSPLFVRGDCNVDGRVDIADSVNFLLFLFTFLPSDPGCMAACDTDASGSHNLTDAVYTLVFLFHGESAPSSPFPECGPAGSADLSCIEFPPCL